MNINFVSINTHVFMLNSNEIDGEGRNIHSQNRTQVCHSLIMLGYSQLSQIHPSIVFVYSLVREPAFPPIFVEHAISNDEGSTGH